MQSANQQIVYLSDICGAPNHRGEDTSGQLRTSSYCIFVKLPKRPECVLLVHGYTGAYDEVSADVAAFLYRRRTLSSPLYGSWSTELDIAPDDSVLLRKPLRNSRDAVTSRDSRASRKRITQVHRQYRAFSGKEKTLLHLGSVVRLQPSLPVLLSGLHANGPGVPAPPSTHDA